MRKSLLCFAAMSTLAGSAFATDYVRVKASPESWAGEYVVGSIDADSALIWTGIDAASCYQKVKITDDVVSGDDLVSLVIEAMAEGEGYSIKLKGGANDGKYISSGSSAPTYANGVKFIDKATRVDIALTEDNLVAMSQTISESEIVYFIYNSNGNNWRYRFYKGNNYGNEKYWTPALFKIDTTATDTIEVPPSPKPAIEAGEYYIQNASSGLFLGGANSWGTQGSVLSQGQLYAVSLNEGQYTLTNTALSSGNKTLGYNLYADTNAAENGNQWNIEAVEGKEGVFTIYGKGKKDKVDDAFEGYLAQSATAGHHIGFLLEAIATPSEAAEWRFLTKEQAIAELEGATAANPKDASFLIGDANFSRNHDNKPWTIVASNCNIAGGDNGNMCAESWRSTFTVSQTLTGLPAGVYEVTAQAALTDYANKYDGADYPVVFGNEASVPFFDMDESDRGTDMGTLSNSFAQGKYVVNAIKAVVTDGTLTIGVKGTRTDTWCIWDNFQIKYIGVDLSLLNESYEKAYNDAKALAATETLVCQKALVDSLNSLIASYTEGEAIKALSTQAELEEAISMLNSAVANINTSVLLYAEIAKIASSIADYNLDEAGMAKFDELTGATIKALEDRTLAASDQVVADIKAAILASILAQTTVGTDMTAALPNAAGNQAISNDNWKLQNALGAGEKFQLDTWAGTASGMAVPMIEYWHAAGTALVDNVIYQTLKVHAGVYKVTATTAVNNEQKIELAEGSALLFANDSVVDITKDGTATEHLGNTGTYSVTVKVAKDGELKLGFIIKGANYNWLSFKDVKLEYTAEVILPKLDEVNTIAHVKECYEAGTLKDNDTITVSGYIVNMFLKPSNFERYGSVSYWINDTVTGTVKEFELYNCYGYNGDTLASYAGQDTIDSKHALYSKNIDVDYVVSRDGYTFAVGDYIEAKGAFKLYNKTYELNTGCYITKGGTPAPVELTDCDLTREMFYQWSSYEAGATIVGNGYSEGSWGTSAGTVYGNPNVLGNEYADLTGYACLALTVTEGTPRLLLNRQSNDGSSSDFLEIKDAANEYVISVADGIWYIDIAKITTNKGYAHLNVIKGANWVNVNITAAKLYVEVPASSIEAIEVASKATNSKIIENGRVVIIKNGQKFNVNGMLIK